MVRAFSKTPPKLQDAKLNSLSKGELCYTPGALTFAQYSLFHTLLVPIGINLTLT